MKYYSSYLLIFIVLRQCKDCAPFASLMFHNELANFASARLLLTEAIYFVQAVAQLWKPHLMALLQLTNLLQLTKVIDNVHMDVKNSLI